MTGLEALNTLCNHIEAEMGGNKYFECKEALSIIEKELKKIELVKKIINNNDFIDCKVCDVKWHEGCMCCQKHIKKFLERY